MARDYARHKLQPKRKQTAMQKNWRRKGWLLTLIVCMVGVILIGIHGYKNNKAESVAAWIAHVKLYLSHKKMQTASRMKDSLAEQAKQEPEVHFNFYTELPKAQVTLSETERTSSPQQVSVPRQVSLAAVPEKELPLAKKENKNSAANTDQYILQIGVFNNETTAGQMRVSLLLAGVEADLVKNPDGNQTIYRLQKGPYATLAQAKKAQKQLQGKGSLVTILKIS